MNAQVITIEFAEQWPLQPWAAAVRTAAAADQVDTTTEPWTPSAGAIAAEPSRRHRDRGASAVEWVVITAIAVAIVSVVGGVIYNSVSKKANDTDKQIQDVNPANNPTGL